MAVDIATGICQVKVKYLNYTLIGSQLVVLYTKMAVVGRCPIIGPLHRSLSLLRGTQTLVLTIFSMVSVRPIQPAFVQLDLSKA